MLLTKLHIPRVGDNIVHRPHLFEKLNQGLKRKLILVSASAGFGKTSIISDWIKQNNIKTAWFSIDKNDNDSIDFLSYIIYGIQRLKKDFGKSALELLQSPSHPNAESTLNLLINEIYEIQDDFLLVFDDYHLIENMEINSLMSYLLEYLPENAHLAIITRSDPNLPIAKLRSQRQLIELRSEDLSFTENDIANLFNKKLKYKLSAEDIFSLRDKTEGWVSGLQLAAMSMHGNNNASEFIKAFAGNNRFIMDYLIEEVIKNQTEDIKEFLLKTSILEQISAPLCNVLLQRNDSQLILEDLEKQNTFLIPLDEERNWYRYHHLFADLLKQRLMLTYKPEINALHNKACDWFTQNEMHELALNHTFEIKDFERCIEILNQTIEEMWQKGYHQAIIKYGDKLPDNLVKQHPEFCLYYSWVLIAAGQLQKAEPFILSAEDKILARLKEEPNDLIHKQLLGKISVALAYYYSHEENSDKTLTYCETAKANLPKEDPLWYSWMWFSFGVSHFANGDLDKSLDAFYQALDYGRKTGNLYLLSTIVIRLAENEQVCGNYKSAHDKCIDILNQLNDRGYSELTKTDWTFGALYFNIGIPQFVWGDFENAFKNIKIAFELAQSSTDVYLRVLTHMVYVFVLKETGSGELKEKAFELDEFIKNNEVPQFLMWMYRGWKMYLFMEAEQLDEAQKYIKDLGLSVKDDILHTNEVIYVSYTRLLLFQGKLDEAEILRKKLFDLVSKSGKLERVIELKILNAYAHKVKGDFKKGVAEIVEAMEIAAEENLLSYFTFNFHYIKELVEEAFIVQATQKTNIPDLFIKNLKTILEKRAKLNKTSSNQFELSSRELDTLKQIAENLTNQEIADKLFISLNTVKTHLKNINLKLGVNNRNQAVEKAREVGLI